MGVESFQIEKLGNYLMGAIIVVVVVIFLGALYGSVNIILPKSIVGAEGTGIGFTWGGVLIFDDPKSEVTHGFYFFRGMRGPLFPGVGKFSGVGVYSIPFWFVLAITLPPWYLLRLYARSVRRLAAKGKYCHCGYDLIGNESGVCPECGNAVTLERGHETSDDKEG